MTAPGDAPADAALRSTRFRAEREGDWRRLEALVARAERGGTGRLTYDEARDLAALYRRTANALSVARAISLDRALLDYLEALTARAYLTVYAPQSGPGGALARFLARGAPEAVRDSAAAIAVAAAAMALGAALGWLLYAADPAWFGTIVPDGLAGGRGPGASTADLRAAIYGPAETTGLAAFAAYLFSNNTLVAILAFGLGAFAAVPTLWLLLYNGAILGAFLGLHADRGLGWDLGGWLSVHGVTELSAIVLAGAGGVRLGAAALFPGPRPRAAALRHAARPATRLALTAALMLVAAALLEGYARQLIQDIGLRYAVGWGVGAMWLAWFLAAGRDRGR